MQFKTTMLVLVSVGVFMGIGVVKAAAAPSTAATQAGSEQVGMIARSSVGKYGNLLALDAKQTEAAMELYDGYSTAFRSAVREYRDECANLRRTEADKAEALQERLAGARTQHLVKTEQLERSFLEDLKTLLTPAQAESWPSVERARRRERYLRGVVSGETVDLFDVVESLRPTPDEMTTLAPLLSVYEVELDRALLDKARVIKEEDPFAPRSQMSAGKIMSWTPRSREIGLKIRDLNNSHASRLERALPEARRTTFRVAFKSVAFPTIYRPTAGVRLLAAVGQMTDLDQSQQEAIDSLRRSYTRDMAAANEALEAAVVEAESKNLAVIMPNEAGGSTQVLMGAKDNAVLKAHGVKSSLDATLRERLNTLLKPVQLDRLPEREAQTEQVFMDDTAVMIQRAR